MDETRKHEAEYRKKLYIDEHGDNRDVQKPREICPDCGETRFLKWGPIRVNPYWSHFSTKPCAGDRNILMIEGPDRAGQTETIEHNNAKTELIRLLGEKSVIVRTLCSVCEKTVDETMPKLEYAAEVRMETDFGPCVWDVAGMNATRVPVVGLEVKFTHETTNALPRCRTWWAELRAGDILSAAKGDSNSNCVMFVNIRSGQICRTIECLKIDSIVLIGDCKKEKPTQEMGHITGSDRINERPKVDWSVRIDEPTREKLAHEMGHITDSGRYTTIVDWRNEDYKYKMTRIDFCLGCGETKSDGKKQYAFCWYCRNEIREIDLEWVKSIATRIGLRSSLGWITTPITEVGQKISLCKSIFGKDICRIRDSLCCFKCMKMVKYDIKRKHGTEWLFCKDCTNDKLIFCEPVVPITRPPVQVIIPQNPPPLETFDCVVYMKRIVVRTKEEYEELVRKGAVAAYSATSGFVHILSDGSMVENKRIKITP